jgi:Flp pilus assembly pilin Flp
MNGGCARPRGMVMAGPPGGGAERGATLVEYALGLAVLVLAIAGGASALEDAGRSEVDNQANCVSERPPPDDCLVRTVTTTTAPEPGGDPVDPPEPPAPAEPLEVTVGWRDPVTEASVAPPGWRIELTADLRALVPDPDDPDDQVVEPVEGAVIRVRIRVTQPPSSTVFTAACVTGPGGSCTIDFDVPNVTTLQVTVDLDDVLLPDHIPQFPEDAQPGGAVFDDPGQVAFDRPVVPEP